MGYVNLSASGSGISNGKLQKTGSVVFTISPSSLSWFRIDLYPYAIDWNGNKLKKAETPGAAGGNWSYEDNLTIYEGSSKSFTISMDTFRSYFSDYSNLGGLCLFVSIVNSPDGWLADEEFNFYFIPNCGAPTSPAVSQTLSRGAVTLSWGAGSGSANNSVTGYDVQRRESTDGSNWGSWATVSGSPVTGTSLDVTPPGTVGSYYQYRVRTRGSAGSDYYSGWVTSTNTLRRKWDAFGAWTDQTLTAGVSSIRAVHLTQLQERIAAIRAFYGLSAYSFTAVTARKTKIAKWAALIGELRSAIDGITTNHAAWNTLEAGKPRIAHITQLRDIIDNM